MAIHRTKIQKQQAAEKRKMEYAFQSNDVMLQSVLVGDQKTTPPKEVTPATKQTVKPLESGLAHHTRLTAAYLGQDLHRTMIVTFLLGLLLIGIWLATRYNGLSRLL